MKYFRMMMLGVALIVPVAVEAQDRDHRDNQQNRTYEDKSHHDSHQWNDKEDEAYRRYLQENHKTYHDFPNAKKREQNNYWNWRHSHSDDDHR